MPGICCIAHKGFNQRQLLESMANSIKHEDWYRVDMYETPFCGIARVHLGIFNPEPQPIFNEDKSLCIFMYGKIYDYEEEKRNLQRQGHKFLLSDSDPEFCLHLYEELGNDFVTKLNGSFVIAICNLKTESILIMNDRYGLRPLYYTVNDSRLLVASEVKAILEDKTVKREINDEAVVEFLVYGEITGNKTFFKDIEVLPPASVFSYQDGRFSIRQYWDYDYNPDYSITAAEYAGQLAQTFTKAVNMHIKGNLRYGLMLSGGLDSRMIAAAMDKEAIPKVVAYTFGSSGCPEYKVARKVAEKLSMKHVFIEYQPEEAIPYAERAVYVSDAFNYVGMGANFHAFYKIAENVDVLINGLPGDLSLGGCFANQRMLNAKSDEALLLLLESRRILSDDMMARLFVGDYYARVKDMPINLLRKALDACKKIEHPGNKVDYFLLKNRVRRTSMMGDVLQRVSHEDATPFYDNDFVDIILKVPPEWRLKHYVYLKMFKLLSPELAKITYANTMLPVDAPHILWRPGIYAKELAKRIDWVVQNISGGRVSLFGGYYNSGLPEWMRTNEKWRKFVIELLLSRDSLTAEYFNREFISKLIKNHETAVITDQSYRLCFLMNFELFLRFWGRT